MSDGVRSHEFETVAPIDVRVEASLGRITVVASPRSLARVEVRPSRPSRGGDLALVRETEILVDSRRLVVDVPRRSSFFGRPDTVDVRIDVPHGSAIEARSSMGTIELRGDLGVCRLVTRYGTVRAESAAEADVEAPYGTVEIGRVAGRLSGSFGHGEACFGAVGGPTHLRGSHGTLRLGDVMGPADIATSGKVALARTQGDLDVRTAYGSITVDEAGPGVLRLASTHAKVSVGVQAGVSVWLDARTRYGKVRNDLVADPQAACVEGGLELHLRSQSADVRVHRSVVARADRTVGHSPWW